MLAKKTYYYYPNTSDDVNPAFESKVTKSVGIFIPVHGFRMR